MTRANLNGFAILLTALLFLNGQAVGHEANGPRGQVTLNWTLPNISRVLSAGYGETFGLDLHPRKGFPKPSHQGGRTCFTGSFFAFDVDDKFAFDIDEMVTLTVLLNHEADHSFFLAYDRNANAESNMVVEAERQDQIWYQAKINLRRARFANRGQGGSDFVVAALGADSLAVDLGRSHQITLCDIRLELSGSSPNPVEWGQVDILVSDEKGRPTPVRMGLYDASGRMPLPSNDALIFPHYADLKKQHFLRITWDSKDPWPAANRNIFYVDGRYQARLPAGRYRLVMSKGPEYRMVDRTVDIVAGQVSKLEIALTRWHDMPQQGWYSGDGHIHISRTKDANPTISAFLRAEDVHVSNLLQMGNPNSLHFRQYTFGPEGRYSHDAYTLVPGVEDPRTAHRGHAIALNIARPLRAADHYFHYHKVLDAYGAQGGLRGYAHVGSGWFMSERGLAVDVPFGLVDFVEIMQFGSLHTELWYDFLNLGYRLLPMAGSDFPYIDQPGSVRSYVKLNGPFSAQAWFDALKAGRTFVTNGPFLTFTVNHEPMGSVLAVDSGGVIVIDAGALLNPDFDQLDRLELVVRGEVVRTVEAAPGQPGIELRHTMKISDGLWIAVRAYGKAQALAHSSPIYVHTSTSNHMDVAAAPAIIDRLAAHLQALKSSSIKPVLELEYWQVNKNLEAQWLAQKPELEKRADEALKRYRALKPTSGLSENR